MIPHERCRHPSIPSLGLALVVALLLTASPGSAARTLPPEVAARGDREEVVADMLGTLALAPAALLEEADPLCTTPITGTIVLDRDVNCTGIGGLRLEPGAVLDLNGFTVEGGGVVGVPASDPGSSGPRTIRNGTLYRTDGLFEIAILENVRIIEAQRTFAVQDFEQVIGCHFEGNQVALDSFFRQASFVLDSTFVNNAIGILMASGGVSLVSGNEFQGNQTGIRIWNERGGPSGNTIADNLFEQNGIGIVFFGHPFNCPNPSQPCLEDNEVRENRFVDNGDAGVLLDWSACESDPCRNFSAAIVGNVFEGNGFDPVHALAGVDDGIHMMGPTSVNAGVTITGNVAVANADLGIETPDAADGGGNRASGNANSLQCVGVACSPAWAVVHVAPADLDFGSVDVGSQEVQIVTVSNVGGEPLEIENVALVPGSWSEFSLIDVPPLPATLAPGDTADVSIAFAPLTEAPAAAVLRIVSDDPVTPVVDVLVAGAGVPFDAQALELLALFDDAVARGDLVGSGPGASGPGRLGALRGMIEAAGDLLERGWTPKACAQLEAARERTDGAFPPPDFVQGPAAPELEAEIDTLRDHLGCASTPGWGPCGLGGEAALVLVAARWWRRRRSAATRR